MIRLHACILALLGATLGLMPVTARAGDDKGSGSALLDAFARWVDKAVAELRLPGSPAPSRATIATVDHDAYGASAVFGQLIQEQSLHGRPTRTEVVVGDAKLDSSRFSGRTANPISGSRLVVDDVPLAFDRDLWLATDDSYKKAVQRYGIKRSALAALGGEPPPPDWSPAPAVQIIKRRTRPAPDGEALKALAVEASARLKTIPGLRHGEVSVAAMEGEYVLATSEGTRLIQPEGYATLVAYADLLRDDGVLVMDARQWLARDVAGLPKADRIVAAVEKLGRSVVQRAAADVVDYYEGPVLFEGEAAADLLRHLLPDELVGTPPPPSGKRTYRQQVRSGPRLGRRLLPKGWSVVDDPKDGVDERPGAFRYDREGVAAQRVVLVKDGFVRDLLMSRVPRHDLQRSNGHARGLVQGRWEAGMSVWSVKPPKRMRRRTLLKMADRARRAARQDRLLVVRRLAPQADRDSPLPRPTEAVWRLANGREEPVVSLAFQRVDRRTLRDIMGAAGGMQERAYFVSSPRRAVSGVPAVVKAPEAILVGGMEAVFPGEDTRPPVYPPPPLVAGDRPEAR